MVFPLPDGRLHQHLNIEHELPCRQAPKNCSGMENNALIMF